MILFLTILILALLVPVILKTDGIDQPTPQYRRAYEGVGNSFINFILPRGQPEVRASIITQKTPPRNKGKPN